MHYNNLFSQNITIHDLLVPTKIQRNMYEQKSQKMYLRTCVPSEDSDQTAHLRSLIRIFTGLILESQGCKASSCIQWRLWSKSFHVHVDFDLRWAHMLGGKFSHIVAHDYKSWPNKTKRIPFLVVPYLP